MKYKDKILSWCGILLGSTIMAAGYVIFINPYNIVPGGIYGASIVLHTLFPGIQVGSFGYCFDIPLLILSFLLLSTRLGAKTVVASLTTPLIMNTLSMLVYPTKEALQTLDPAMLLGGRLDLSDHLMLAVIGGSMMIGIGCGIVVRNGATTGGTDIVAMLMQKYLKIRFSSAIAIADSIVVLFGLVVFCFGLGPQDTDVTATSMQARGLMLSLYSLTCIYLTSRILARTINGKKDDKLLFIISDKHQDELHDFILNDLERTATLIKSSGMYSQQDKEMIFIVISYKEVQDIKQRIKEVAPDAFVVVTDAYDAYGEGWKPLPSRGELQPE